MASTAYMTVGGVLNEYTKECELFEALLRFGHPRELSKQLVVLWMWLFSRPALPFSLSETGMIPNVRLVSDSDASAVHAAGNLDEAVKKSKAALSQIRTGSAAPATTSETPSYLRYLYDNKYETVMGMATMINMGIPAVIFDDELRRSYLRDGQTPRLSSPFQEIGREIAAFHKITETQRTVKFRFDRKHERDYKVVMVGAFEKRFGVGCVEKVVFDDDVNPIYPAMFTGQVVFEEPASYLQFAFNRDGKHEAKFAADGNSFFILP